MCSLLSSNTRGSLIKEVLLSAYLLAVVVYYESKAALSCSKILRIMIETKR